MTLTILTVVGSLYLAWYYIKLINKIDKLEKTQKVINDALDSFVTKEIYLEDWKRFVILDDTGFVCDRRKVHTVTVERSCNGGGFVTTEHYSRKMPYSRVVKSIEGNVGKVKYFKDNVEVTEKGKIVK